MIDSLTETLPYVIAGLFILSVLALALSLHQLRRGRTGAYWRLRRTAGQRGGRLLLLALALFGVAFTLALFSGLADAAYRRVMGARGNSLETPYGVALVTFPPTASATASTTATPTLTLTPTLSPTVPTATPSPTLTRTPTATPTFTLTPTITLTPTATFERVLSLTLPPSPRQPQPDASLRLTGAALSAEDAPVRQFDAGIRRLYLFFDYENMDNGVGWSRVLYRDGMAVQGQTYLWSLGGQGTATFYFGDDKGYPPGRYEVRLYIGQEESSRLSFTVAEAFN